MREATSTVSAVRLQTPRRLQSTHLRTGVSQGSADYQHLIQTYHFPYLRPLLLAVAHPPALLIVPANSKPSERESRCREGASQPTGSGVT